MSNIPKFRAWDKINENMINVHCVDFDEQNINNFSHDGIIIPKRKFDDVVLMRYTGLLDKNGVGIYEGDIVQDKNNVICTVSWHGSYASFIKKELSKNSVKRDWDFLYLSYMRLCVIGNIYENKELLE